MANETTIINGITKRELNGSGLYYYYFEQAIIISDTANNRYIRRLNKDRNRGNDIITAFADITDKMGATDIEEYTDILAENGYYTGSPSNFEATLPDEATQDAEANGAKTVVYHVELSQTSSINVLGVVQGASINFTVVNLNGGSITLTVTAPGYTVTFYENSDGDMDGNGEYTFTAVADGNGKLRLGKLPKLQ